MKLKIYYISVLILSAALLTSLIILFAGLYKKTQMYCNEIPAMAYSKDAENFTWDELWENNTYPYDEEEGIG